MRAYLLIAFFFVNSLFSQDRLSFVIDNQVKKEIQRSIDYLSKTQVIPKTTKSKIIFISINFEEISEDFEINSFGFSYSSYIPTLLADLDYNGQFKTDPQNKWILYYNYSPNIVLVIRNGFRFFDREQMKKLSSQIRINRRDLMKSEYFHYQKGDQYNWDIVNNYMTFDKIGGHFIPVRVNTFDLKTFVEVWYDVEVGEIPLENKKSRTK